MVCLLSYPLVQKRGINMQKIIRIARLELSVLFYSPIAWIIMVILFVQCGLNYTDNLYTQETYQQLERPLAVVTRVLFAGEYGMLSSLIEYLYLYIPLLTMSVFSREYTSGSIKLLQSSPVTASQIVLGKYLSIVAYALLIVALLSLYAFSAYYSIAHMDLKFVLSGLFGLFLLICTYAAIGLFMSSLTAYQIVAAISTLTLLAFLNYAPVLGAGYDGLREVTQWLSIGGRAEGIVNGLLTTRDLFYFLLIIAFFLGITILRIVQERAGLSLFKKTLQYVGLALVLSGIGYVSSLPRFNFYYDTTQIKDVTISPAAQAISARITDPIKLVSFVNVLDHKAGYGAPKNRTSDKGRFEGYQRFIPQLQMEYIAYYDSVPHLMLDSNETILSKAQKSAEALGFGFKRLLTPEQMKQYPEIAKESNSFVRYFHYKGQSTPLRMYDDMLQYPGESEISAALLRLLDGPGKIGLLVGHEERSIDNHMESSYSLFLNGNNVRGSVINQGFIVEKITNEKLLDFHGVGLIIADPQKAFSNQELDAIYQYIDRGGNLLLMAEPTGISFLQPIAHKLGLQFVPGTLLQESENFDADLLRVEFTQQAKEEGFKFYDGALVVMNKAMGIERINQDSTFRYTPLLETDSSTTWNKVGPFDLAKEKVHFDERVDSRVGIASAIQLERAVGNHKQKIIVAGDADFLSNAEMSRFNITSVNSSFAMRIFKSFSDGKFPVSGPKEKAPDITIKANRSSINWQKVLFLGVVPLLLGGMATLVLRNRKRK